METSLKTGFAQIFSCCPKNLSCPNFGGAAAPLAPPARTPMHSIISNWRITKFLSTETTKSLVHAFVTSKLDNCITLLYGAPKNKIQRLQYGLKSKND